MRCVLAIDQSTSATKALLFGQDGEVIDMAGREHRQIYPQPGWVEHDAEEIWRNTLDVVAELAGRQPTRVLEVGCVSLCNQRETIVIFEKGSGRPLRNAIVWQCRRGDVFCREQLAMPGRRQVIEAKTGLRVDSYFSGSKLQWVFRNRPEIREKVLRGEALIGTIDTYLIYRLSKGQVFATDPTNASRTLLYDIDALSWDDTLCEWWETPRGALPEVLESSAVFGETDFENRLPRPTPICGVMGDSQAALLAHGCIEPGQAKATFGTGTSVLLNLGPTRPLRTEGSVTALAWVQGGIPTYALEGIITYSAATLVWLRDQLGLVKHIREIEELAAQVESSQGVYLVPAFSGLGAPYWNEEARAAIVGMSAHSDRRHVARAALESIAYQLRDVMDMMQAEGAVSLNGIHADGGASSNRLLMQLCADLTRTEMRLGENPHCSPLGAVMMAWIGMGWCKSFDQLPPLNGTVRRVLPSKDASSTESSWIGWREAVERVSLPSKRRQSVDEAGAIA